MSHPTDLGGLVARFMPEPNPNSFRLKNYSEVQQHERSEHELLETASAKKSPSFDGGWQPFWTRHYVLSAFAICFAMILAALEVVDWHSDHNQGIATAEMNQYYLWTYGPTALLTLVLALWNRVDYRVRQLTPWINLSRQPPCKRTNPLFLDYITPTLPEILWHSLRNRDWSVLISGFIGLLQTIAIIFSTGLFVLSPAQKVTNNIEYKTTSRFVENDNITLFLGSDSLPLNVYDAIKTLELAHPIGTTDKYAYQTFVTLDSKYSETAIQQATVDVVSANLDCEPADMHVDQWAYSWAFSPCYVPELGNTGPSFNVSIHITSGNCNITSAPSYSYGSDGDLGNFAILANGQCDVHGDIDDNSNDRLVIGFGQAKQIGDVGPVPTVEGCNDTAPWANIEVIKSQYWICKAELNFEKANVTLNSSALLTGAKPDIEPISDEPVSMFSNISLWYFEGGVLEFAYKDNYQKPTSMPVNLSALVDPEMASEVPNEVRILERVPTASLEELLNSDLFLNESKGYFTELTALTINTYFTVTDGNETSGSVITNEQRLFTRGPPLRALQGIMATTMLLIFGLVLLRRPTNIPHDLASLGGLIDVLVHNRHFSHTLQGTGALSVKKLSFLSKRHYQSRLTNAPGFDLTLPRRILQLSTQLSSDQTPLKRPSHDVRHVDGAQSIESWWRPATIKVPARIAVSLLTVSLIVVLQVLQYLSRQRNGLLSVSVTGDQHLTWSLVPAALMASVAMYFKALNGVYRIFAPYCQLRKGGSHQSTIGANYLSSTDIEVLIRYIRDRQPGPLFTTMTALISAFLTIIVSGVFTASISPVSQNTAAELLTWFNISSLSDNGTAGNNAIISGLILEANLPYPTMTYENLAFGSMQEPNFARLTEPIPSQGVENDARFLNRSYVYQVVSPAIRSSLNCTTYAQGDIHGLTYYAGVGSSHSYHGIYANLPGSASCTGSTLQLISGNAPNAGTPPFEFSSAINGSTEGCPDIYYFWGQQTSSPSNGSNTSVNYARAMSCFETIEEVYVNVTFSMPGFVINSDNPPMINETSKRTISSAKMALPYDQMPAQTSNDGGSLNPNFFVALGYKFGIPEAAFGDPAQAEAVAEAIQNQHYIVRAQQYNAALRVQISSTIADEQAGGINNTVDGLAILSHDHRLFVNEVSTDVLCALLAAMVICMILASWLMSTKEILPKNPCSIVAMASLLADSNMVQDPRTYHLSNQEFRMGWFQSGADNERVFTIDRVIGRENDAASEPAISESEHELIELSWPVSHSYPSYTYSNTREETDSISLISREG